MHTQDNIARLESALLAIPAPADYNTWLFISMGFKEGGGSYETWDTWCKQMPGYNEAENYGKWIGFEQGKRTAATVFYFAKENGWTDPRERTKTAKAAKPTPPPPLPGAPTQTAQPPPPPSAPGNAPSFPAATTKGKEISPQTIIKRAAELRAEALPYLEKRGITADTAERFNIGFIRRFEEAETIEDRIIIPYPGEAYYTARRLSNANAGDKKKYSERGLLVMYALALFLSQ